MRTGGYWGRGRILAGDMASEVGEGASFSILTSLTESNRKVIKRLK